MATVQVLGSCYHHQNNWLSTKLATRHWNTAAEDFHNFNRNQSRASGLYSLCLSSKSSRINLEYYMELLETNLHPDLWLQENLGKVVFNCPERQIEQKVGKGAKCPLTTPNTPFFSCLLF